MGIKKLIMILASLSFTVTAMAQDMEGEKKPFSIYGDFATSLSFFDSEHGGAGTSTLQNPFNSHDDFAVNLLEINLEKNWSNSKLHISIGYGNTALAVNNITTTASRTLNVMNAYYKMTSDYGVGFWIGKFESPVGHEVYNHMNNAQFTRSYGFMLAPYFSTGLGVDYSTDMWRVGLIAANGAGSDTDTQDDNKTLSLIVDVDPMENLHIDLNYVTGTEGFGGANSNLGTISAYTVSIIDASAAFMLNEMLDFAVNYVNNSQDASGTEAAATSIAAYVNANFGMFGLGLRYEMFDYEYGFRPYNGPGSAMTAVPATAATDGEDNSLSAITLAAKAEIDQNALVMLEYRMDSTDDKVFVDSDGAAADSFSTITAALMYRF